ncbi:MAG: response regulator [Thermodesulfobacteriota bacterium]
MADPDTTPAPLALLANADRAEAAVDRTFLREAGFSAVRTVATGREVLELLDREHVLLVVAGDRLEDMDGLDLLRKIRSRPLLIGLPVLLASTHNAESAVLAAVAAGGSGYLIRPYSRQAFAQQIKRAFSGRDLDAARRAALARVRQEADAGKAEKAAAMAKAVAQPRDQARALYEQGLVHLAARRLDQAIAAFNRALALDGLLAEAYIGLARAWKNKGRPDLHRTYLQQAAEVFARQRRFLEARKVLAEVMAANPRAANPFLEAAHRLLRKGLYEEAARLYLQAESTLPVGHSLHAHLARACHFTPDPETAARCLAAALAAAKGKGDPRDILTLILGAEPRAVDDSAPDRPGILPPGLQDAWNVVKFTYKAFSSGRPPQHAALPPLDL